MSEAPHGFPDDLANPYAPPRAEIGSKAAESEADLLIPLTPGGVLSYSYRTAKERFGLTLGAVLIPMGLGQLFQLGMNYLLRSAAPPVPGNPGAALAPLGLSLVAFVFQTWLTLGQSAVLLQIAQRRQVSLLEVFSGGRYLLRSLGAFLLLYLVILGIAAACFIPAGIISLAMRGNSVVVIMAWIIAGIAGVVGWIFAIVRLSQFQYLIIDRDLGVMDSLKTSAQMTRGKVSALINIGIMEFLVVVGGLLALVVGLLFAVPLAFLMMAVTYLALREESKEVLFHADDFFAEPKRAIDREFDGVL